MAIQQVLASFGGSFMPNAAFFAGNVGFAYDPTNFANLFQDSAGTTAVTTTGQPVGKVLDLSGNGSHRTQPTAGYRPLTATGGRIQYDGVDDGMVSNANTALGGTWTYMARLDIQSSTVGIFLHNYPPNTQAYFSVWQSGSGSVTNDATGSTVGSLAVNGTAVADNRGSLYSALTGGEKTVFVSMTALSNSNFASTFRDINYPGAVAAVKKGRELLINRALSAPDIALVRAWLEAA
jgi:hypothetical protein